MKQHPTSPIRLRNDFLVGIDVGGTKIHVLDTLSTNLHRYSTSDFPDLYGVLDAYFEQMQAHPKRVTVAMAGPRNDVTGEIKMTNCPWPAFNPQRAAERYPDVSFVTTNDMVATAAGVVSSSGIDLVTLKPGIPTATGTKYALTISTGVGGCAAIWDERSQKYVFAPCEPGQTGFQPYDQFARDYLAYLAQRYQYPSVELAISGKYGIENLLKYHLTKSDAPELRHAIERAEKNDRPLGAVLLEFATEGKGNAKERAHALLDHMGTLVGSMLGTFALAYKTTGGIYLTGSVSLGLAEYWAEHTGFAQAFIRKGTPSHAPWLEDFTSSIPIYLSTDPHIAAAGALQLSTY